jgi:protein associated with RNAse G/E
MRQGSIDPTIYRRSTIKSFKHDGSLHRIWLENWRIPEDRLHPEHAAESAIVLLNDHTPIREADGKEWISRVPAVVIFLPDEWFNVVALLEDKGIRYYCNVASPPYQYQDVLTYIDYDLDAVMMPDGSLHELDREEFNRHRVDYRYDGAVVEQAERALERLKDRMSRRCPPFGDELIRRYYQDWNATIRPRRADRP